MLPSTVLDMLNVIKAAVAPVDEHRSTQNPSRHADSFTFVITQRPRRAKAALSGK